MSIIIDDRTIGEIYHGSQAIREVYHGADLVWSARRGSTMDWQWGRARSQPLRVMFIGSSTIQGHGVEWSEGLVYQLTGHIASHLPGVEAAPMVKRTSGSYRASTDGFHFLNAGVGGTTSSNYYGPDRQSLVVAFQPHIVVHMVGSNDYSLQRSLNDYRDDLVAVVNNVLRNAISGDTRQLFIHAPRREDIDDTAVTNKWADYGRVLREVAEDTTRGEFLDAGDLFDRARGTDAVFASDRVHLNERGNSILAQVIAAWWGLDSHEDEVIYGFDAAEWAHLAPGTRMSSFTPDGVLQSGTGMTASGDYRPTLRDGDGGRYLDFTGGNRKMETGDWGGVQALPLTVYVVLNRLSSGGGTVGQPLWSRSGVDSGYTWTWYDRDSGTLNAASGSALSPGTPIGGSMLTDPLVLAISFLPSGHSRIYLNSLEDQQVPVQTPDVSMGPWMRSLKLGTNYGEANWSEMTVREMWWHHGADPATVQTRITTLADKHDITVLTRASGWDYRQSPGTATVTVPDWADGVQLVAVGAGGGGSGGGFFATGDGGRAGSWAHTSVTVTSRQSLVVRLGQPGTGASSNSNNGTAGADATATLDGTEVIRAVGGGPGTSTSANQSGRSAGTRDAFGMTFVGGGAANAGQLGNDPGGGGGPGGSLSAGNRGGYGRVWWRFVAH
ncbi:SGNH/GDSL hydrolase family protein [Corynebacterium kalidii]